MCVILDWHDKLLKLSYALAQKVWNASDTF